ncbi:MAG: hypothetical protein HKN23_20235 [Verrucomicrobiales bacterium]|nr:hypothetical protein [Verrucomicrobiales bacterium]
MAEKMQHVATPKQLRAVLIFTIAYILVAAAVIIARRNLEFIIYLFVMAMIIAATLGVYRRAGLSFPLLCLFSIWGLSHMLGGIIHIPGHWHSTDTTAVLYNWRILPGYLKYDQLVHGFGVGLVTWTCWQALSHRVCRIGGAPLRPTFGLLALCATAGMGFGALNEVVEFLAVLILPKTNVGDYENTGWDLVANLVGAATAAVAIFAVYRHRLRTNPAPS